VSLAEAREEAAKARRLVREGINPIDARKASLAEQTAALYTFGTFAEEVLDSIEGGFRNEMHKAQWRMSLSIQRDKDGEWLDTGYCISLRDKALDDIGTDEVLAVLRPIWNTLPETASRVRGRIERVLDAARVRGLRGGENPARWKGHLAALLSKRQKLTRGHHKALPYAEVPGLLVRLHDQPSMAALALEWTILAASRTTEALHARLPEIDRKAKVWVIPPERMKAGREHRAPLTDRMLEIIDLTAEAREAMGTDLLFPGAKAGRPMSGMAMTMLLRRLKVDATVHGFRSSFRDWVYEGTDFAGEIAEAALAHVTGDATERAYRRGDALERRRKLMDSWANYCLSSCPSSSAGLAEAA
jgi:integrase